MSILIIFCCVAIIFSCYKVERYKSTLTVENLPEGEYFLSVYSIDIDPDNLLDIYNKRTGYSALSDGNSPFNLIWYETITGGNKYVVIKTSTYGINKYITKYSIVTFAKNGNATVNWNNMADFIR